jgi:hypothetical protein
LLENAEIISDDLALAHINAGDYHWAISHCYPTDSLQHNAEKDLARDAWRSALLIAQQERLPDYLIMVEARPDELDEEIWINLLSVPADELTAK